MSGVAPAEQLRCCYALNSVDLPFPQNEFTTDYRVAQTDGRRLLDGPFVEVRALEGPLSKKDGVRCP